MPLTSMPLTMYGMFRQPFKIIKFVKLALQGFKINRNRAYNIYNGPTNQTFFYVGPHDEDHLFLLSKKAGPSGKLVVFTSTKKSHALLSTLKKIAGLKNLVVAPITFSVTSNEVIFAAQPAIEEIVHSAASIGSKEKRSYKKIEISFNETLDNYCLSHNIYPQLLEVRLPWHELAVLKGAKRILKTLKPKLIIECDARFSSKSKLIEVFQFLSELEYKGHFILDSVRIPVSNFDFDIYQNPASDFYCKEFIFE